MYLICMRIVFELYLNSIYQYASNVFKKDCGCIYNCIPIVLKLHSNGNSICIPIVFKKGCIKMYFFSFPKEHSLSMLCRTCRADTPNARIRRCSPLRARTIPFPGPKHTYYSGRALKTTRHHPLPRAITHVLFGPGP